MDPHLDVDRDSDACRSGTGSALDLSSISYVPNSFVVVFKFRLPLPSEGVLCRLSKAIEVWLPLRLLVEDLNQT